MRRISLKDDPAIHPIYTWLIHGDTRTGKSTFAATFPRPYFIADAIEGGWKSIRSSDRSTWWEPDFDVSDAVVAPENMGDLLGPIIADIRQRVARNLIQTIVFDAFSFFADFLLAEILKMQTKADTRAAYGTLGTQLREVRNQLHSVGVNVVWLTLSQHPSDDDPKGRPLIPGASRDKYSAGVDFLWHSRIEKTGAGERFELRTRTFGKYLAGHREGVNAGNLPDPFSGSYSDFLRAIGYDVDALHAKMPPILASPSAAKPPAPQPKPPVAPVARPTQPVSPKAASAPPPAKFNNPNQK